MEKKTKVLVLSSGGIDSTATIKFYLNLGCYVESIFVDFGQVSRKKEYFAVKQITNFYKIKLIKVKTVFCEKNFSGGLIQGRNIFLLSTALMDFKYNSGILAIGIHAGTNYFDCSNEFIEQINSLIKKQSNELISIGSPFIQFNKLEIFKYCSDNGVPLHLTYSCELGLPQPCGKCLSCKDLKRLYEFIK